MPRAIIVLLLLGLLMAVAGTALFFHEDYRVVGSCSTNTWPPPPGCVHLEPYRPYALLGAVAGLGGIALLFFALGMLGTRKRR